MKEIRGLDAGWRRWLPQDRVDWFLIGIVGGLILGRLLEMAP